MGKGDGPLWDDGFDRPSWFDPIIPAYETPPAPQPVPGGPGRPPELIFPAAPDDADLSPPRWPPADIDRDIELPPGGVGGVGEPGTDSNPGGTHGIDAIVEPPLSPWDSDEGLPDRIAIPEYPGAGTRWGGETTAWNSQRAFGLGIVAEVDQPFPGRTRDGIGTGGVKLPPVTIDQGGDLPPGGGVYRRPGNLPSGGWSWDVYRRAAERMVSDSAKRVSTPSPILRSVEQGIARTIGNRIIGVLGPIGAIISVMRPGSLYGPEVLGSGELPSPPPPPSPPGSSTPRPATSVGTPSPSQPAPVPRAGPPSSISEKPEEFVVTGTQPRPFPLPRSQQMRLGRTRRWGSILGPLAGALAISSLRGSSATTTVPLAPSVVDVPTPSVLTLDPLTPAPTIGADPLTPTPGPLTGFNASVQGSYPPTRTPTRTRTKECNCDDHGKRKKKSKPRECLQRAQLVWSSGPKKGKPAGSRCIDYK